MENKFNAIYFDGSSSKANKVIVILENIRWCIKSKDNSFQDIIWDLDKIQKPEVYISGFYSYTYGNIPRQILEISDKTFETTIESQYPKFSLTRKSDSFIFENKIRSSLFFILFFVGISLFGYFVAIPHLSESFVANLQTKTVENIGDFLFENMEAEIDINDSLSILMQDFANKIEQESPFEIQVKVSNSDIVNAFAMPGGKIVVYKGLLDKIENENQLLALLGHEFTHTNERHVLKNLVTNLSGYLLISLVVGDVNGVIAILLENAHMVKQLSFTRELEKEADIYGISLVEKNQADPNGMHELFSLIHEESDTSSHKLLEYISTHPDMSERIEYTKSLAENKPQKTNMVLRKKWLLLKEKLYEL
jgi:Zn-dependent protease with chaperone function